MKLILTTLTTLLLSQAAQASPSLIGEMSRVSSLVMNHGNSLTCYHQDKDRDGKPETSMLTLRNAHMGFLTKFQISNSIDDPTGSVCAKLDEIKQRSNVNFGAIEVVVNSKLYLLRSGMIMENVELTIQNLGAGSDDPKLQLSTEVSMELHQQGE